MRRSATSRLTSVHLFCGAGGDSDGFRRAGFDVVLGANHWQKAVDTHAANFPEAEHLCVDLDHYDMRKLPKARVLVGSPICTEGSPADGIKRPKAAPTPGQLSLLDEGPIADAAWERTRATAYDILRATEVHGFDAVVCENVPRFATAWPLFHWWLQGMAILGYRHQVVSVSAAHVGGEGNPHAPQWRDRIFVVFTRESMRQPDLAVRPPAWCPTCEQDVQAVQSWRNGRTIGKYRQQYDYRCPNGAACGHRIVEPYVRPAASAIDWSDVGIRIGDRPQHGRGPLAASTLRKIRLGLEKHRVPAVVTVNHSDSGDGRAVPAHSSPLATRTVRIGDGIAVPPMLVPTGGNWNTDTTAVTVPMRTRMTRESEGLLLPGPFITEHRGGGSTTRAIADPLASITAGGNHHGLVIPYRKGHPTTTAHPLHTIATRESAGLVLGSDAPPEDIALEDCYFRMLSPREHLRGQRFSDDYTVLGNGGEQTMQAGNAVPSNVAQWIASALLEVL
ncbi:DNA cytosine methyltransferase [Actinacidiphila oryziradicis]|jgi:DNA (cytosine-5)-methyltransferase 1|uniref:DNA cytosine methyltransferase n=1 Tax=Actinacidiphila oryziradicis TaxID=2571141 RepID=UPI0023F27ED7|nr:DNA cytosine methyltransferase [Actinacidiphila oryziradicis]MCW2871279.1 cytosine-specific methylase [Actinacidiphila oryziradicis]